MCSVACSVMCCRDYKKLVDKIWRRKKRQEKERGGQNKQDLWTEY